VPRPTNLLFIFADQLRGQDVGCAGNAAVATPNIDRIAREGVRVRNAVSSYPVCSPYRASLLTGNHVFRNGMYFNDVRMPEHNLCAGAIYADAGYATGYIGKWHLDGQNRLGFTPQGWRRRGFDYWAACNCAHDYFHAFYYRDSPEPIPIEGWEPEGYTDLATSFLRERAEDPFCLFLSYAPPHDPYVAPPEWMERYDAATVPLRANVQGDPRERIAAYWAATTGLDHNVGRLLAELDKLGIADSTLVVFTSDHGDMLLSQGRTKKQQPWEESVLVPFVARGPGIPPGTITDTLLSTVDVLPTVLGLTGVAGSDGMDGIDLSGALLGVECDEPDATYIMDVCAAGEALVAGIAEWRGVRTKRYTYARSRERGWVLYDNREDPYQLRNLVDDTGNDLLRKQLDDLTWRFAERYEDEFREGTHYLELASKAGPDCSPPTLMGPDPAYQVKGK